MTLLSAIQFLFLVHISGCQSTQPNIVITIGSGVGWGDIGVNNAFNTHTPVIDMLGNAGVNYLDFHVGGNTAGPSMAALLTGRHGQRNGVRKNFSPFSIGGLPQSENTIGDYLKGIGYTTGYIGVWDLGHQSPYLPLSRGFDFFYGTPFDPVHGCVHSNNIYIPSNVNLNMKCTPDKIGVPVMEGDNILEQPLNMWNLSIPILYAKAKKFINKASNEKKPFLLIISPTQINLPVFNSNAKYPKKEELLAQLDNAVAMTQELLDTYNLTRNTISMFTSKTGPIDANCDFSGDVGPYLGFWQRFTNSLSAPTMGTNWEGAIKVPLVISWPERISTFYRNIELRSAVDLVPTLSDITGFKLPSDRTFDGMSMTKDWNRTEPVQDPVSRILYFLEPDTDEVFAFRKDDLKIYFRTTGARKCNCTYDPSKQPSSHHPYPLVFDLSRDQSELSNITYDEFRAAAFLEWKKKGDEWFSQDPGLKSTADYSEYKSAVPCCGSLCECSSSVSISDLVFLVFGKTRPDHNYSVIVAEPDHHHEIIPIYGLVFLCLGVSVFAIFVVYKSYTSYMNLKYGYHHILDETEIEQLITTKS